jgi:hypothetical protein
MTFVYINMKKTTKNTQINGILSSRGPRHGLLIREHVIENADATQACVRAVTVGWCANVGLATAEGVAQSVAARETPGMSA